MYSFQDLMIYYNIRFSCKYLQVFRYNQIIYPHIVIIIIIIIKIIIKSFQLNRIFLWKQILG